MERGTFLNPEVAKRLQQFERLKIYTDRPWEREHYQPFQKEITGAISLPTYIVLDSESNLEVSRCYFTNDDDEFIEFLEEGLTNRPAFYSFFRFTNLAGIRLKGPMNTDRGEVLTFMGADARAYRGEFKASQLLEVPADMAPGKYVLRADFITTLYRGEQKLQRVLVPIKLEIEVVAD